MSIIDNLEGNAMSSQQTCIALQHIIMAKDNGFPKSYHCNGRAKFGVWTYRVKNLPRKDDGFHYCLTPPSKPMSEEEQIPRQQVMSIINNNAKYNAFKVLHHSGLAEGCS
jgi:hypothetical protein